MSAQVQLVNHYRTTVSDRAGEGARLLAVLRDAGVNLIALWGYPYGRGRARLEFVPENGTVFADAAKQAKLKLSKKETAFWVQGDDQPGALAEVLEKLAAARISVNAVQGVSAGAGRFGAVLFLTPAATRKAVDILGAA
jgi:prephenate dehydratase